MDCLDKPAPEQGGRLERRDATVNASIAPRRQRAQIAAWPNHTIVPKSRQNCPKFRLASAVVPPYD